MRRQPSWRWLGLALALSLPALSTAPTRAAPIPVPATSSTRAADASSPVDAARRAGIRTLAVTVHDPSGRAAGLDERIAAHARARGLGAVVIHPRGPVDAAARAAGADGILEIVVDVGQDAVPRGVDVRLSARPAGGHPTGLPVVGRVPVVGRLVRITPILGDEWRIGDNRGVDDPERVSVPGLEPYVAGRDVTEREVRVTAQTTLRRTGDARVLDRRVISRGAMHLDEPTAPRREGADVTLWSRVLGQVAAAASGTTVR